jgi:hypothetical protein
MRPNSFAQAKNCVPPGIPCPKATVFHLSKDRPILMYDTVDSAIQMESAFWLERQFCYVRKSATRHWYQHTLQEMIQKLKRNATT